MLKELLEVKKKKESTGKEKPHWKRQIYSKDRGSTI